MSEPGSKRIREALDLWQDDADRVRRAVDLDRIRTKVETSVQRGDVEAKSVLALRRYAAAALVLIGLGVGGAALIGPNPGRAEALQQGAALLAIDHHRIHHCGRTEMESHSFVGRHLDREGR